MSDEEIRMLVIDPSIRACGWALYVGIPEDDTPREMLVRGGLIKTKREEKNRDEAILAVATAIRTIARTNNVQTILVEQPTEFIGTEEGEAAMASGATGMLHQLTGSIQMVAHIGEIEFIWAPICQWKGQTKKKHLKKRLKRRGFKLKESLNHNIIDAIGIGVWYLEELIK